MTLPLKVCAVTSSRADWGLLAPVLQIIRDDKAFALSIVATGQHLVASDGDTAREILREGFQLAQTVDMKLAGDSARMVSEFLGVAITGFGAAFEKLHPDLLLILGDRYEIMGAAAAATLARLPIAHIFGGDVTEGAMDDAFRHSITKMSHVHFVATQEAGHRVRQLGEDSAHVHVLGSPGLDRIRTTKLLERTVFFQDIGLEPRARNVMATFHPETLAAETENDCREMLAALNWLGPETGIIFSGVNADVQGRSITRLIEDFVLTHRNAVLHPSLGSVRYFSALKYCDAIVGNSSSGIYEAPSFGTPTVNIGDRQKGRLRAASVIDTRPACEDIYQAIMRAFAMGRTNGENPFGDGHAAERIVSVLKSLSDPRQLLKKRFMDWPSP